MYKKLKKQNGFTLTEMLVTLLIFSFMVAGIYGVMLAGDSSWNMNKTQIELRQELRKGMDWMKQELRQSGGSAINIASDDSWNTTIDFQTSTGADASGSPQWSANTIRFQKTGTQLTRTENGVIKILALDVLSVRFRRQSLTPNVVNIELITERQVPRGPTMTETLNFNVQMRN